MSNYHQSKNPSRVNRASGWLHRSQRAVGIGSAVIAKLLDMTVTIYGLRLYNVAELNPVAVSAMDLLGILWGLLFLSIITTGVVILTTEFAAVRYSTPSLPALYIRLLGYSPLTVISLGAAVHNVALLNSL
jgi:hypothetical protein